MRIFGLLLLAPIAGTAGTLLNENFDNILLLPGNGWAMVNNSAPVGPGTWFQGNGAVFPANSGAADSYIGNNYLAAAAGGNISSWLITPELAFSDLVQIDFYTRTDANSIYPDELELRVSLNGPSTNVGLTDTSVGDFATLLLTVNPTLAVGGYPETWTHVSAAIQFGSPVSGRIAFRYAVPNTDLNGNYIGIDDLSIQSSTGVPEPGTMGLLGLGLGLSAMLRTRFQR